MLNLFRFIYGYIDVKFCGENVERIINALNLNGIKIWNTYNIDGVMFLSMYMKDYHKIRSLRKIHNDKIKVYILKKYGLPQLRKKISLRLGIPIGLAIFLVVNLVLSQFVWSVYSVGNISIEESEIKKLCGEFGIKPGVYIKSIDTYDTAQNIALRLKKVAWLSVNIEGSEVTVNLTEDEQTEKQDKFIRNIIASKDGVIKSMKVVKGTKIVTVDQTVQKGDLLVSGVVDNIVNTTYVASDGEIIAETIFEFTENIKKSFTYYTNKRLGEKRSVFEFFSLKIPLYLSKPQNIVNSYITTNKMMVMGKELPIGFTNRQFITGEKSKKTLTKQDAENIAINLVQKKLTGENIKKIMKYEIKTSEEANSYNVSVVCYCMENISEFQPIEITDY